MGGLARVTVAGFIELMVGAAPGAATVKVTVLLVPPAVVALILCGPVAALAAITNVAVIWVAVTAGAPLVVIPVGRFSVAPVRLVPVSVTATLVPAVPEVGAMEASVGAAGAAAFTVNVTALLVPPVVVTVTFLAPTAALAAIAKLALTCVAVVLVTVTVTPAMALTVAPDRFVPVRTTGTVTPALPATGAMLVSVGAG